jgi:hypothetical protein
MSSPRLTVGPEENFPGCDYTADEVEFLRAIDRYRRARGRPHPTCREVLAVLVSLGYRKVAEPHVLPKPR